MQELEWKINVNKNSKGNVQLNERKLELFYSDLGISHFKTIDVSWSISDSYIFALMC